MSSHHYMVQNIQSGHVERVANLQRFCIENNINMTELMQSLIRYNNPNREGYMESSAGWRLIEDKNSNQSYTSKTDNLLLG